MSILGDANEEDVLTLAQRLADELTSFVEAGEESGSDMSGPRALLAEWDEVFKKTNLGWQKQLRDADDDIPEIRLD